MVKSLLLAVVLCISCSSCSNLLLSERSYAEYTGNVVFSGWSSKYCVVEVSKGESLSFPSDCPLIFHWEGQALMVKDITPKKLEAAGIKVKDAEAWEKSGTQSAFIGGADSQNQDYGISIVFESGKLVSFNARYSDHNSVACPFQVSMGQSKSVRFPLSEDKLNQVFGPPKNTWSVEMK